MGILDVLADNVARPLLHRRVFANNSDAAAAGRGCRLHDVHLLLLLLTVKSEAFKVFREDVGLRCNFKIWPVYPAHALHMPPHVRFAADTPRTSKMVDFLVGVQVLEPASFEQASPEHVPLARLLLNVVEACHLQSIHHTVVCVRRMVKFEVQMLRCRQIFLVVLDDPQVILGQRPLNFQIRRVREKQVGFGIREQRFD